VSLLFLELAEVLEIHRDQIDRYGGTHGIRDLNLLQSALAMPRAGSTEQYFHSDVFEMAAAHLFHLVKNHPFVDGNKRTGAVVALVFLDINGADMRITNDALVDLVLGVSEGRFQKDRVAEFFRTHVR